MKCSLLETSYTRTSCATNEEFERDAHSIFLTSLPLFNHCLKRVRMLDCWVQKLHLEKLGRLLGCNKTECIYLPSNCVPDKAWWQESPHTW